MSLSPNDRKVIKLKTNEIVVARIPNMPISYHSTNKLTLVDPVLMLVHPHPYPDGDQSSQVFSFLPWAPASDMGECEIASDLVVTILELAPTVWDRYDYFVKFLTDRNRVYREIYEKEHAIFHLLKDVNKNAPVLYFEGKDLETLREEQQVTNTTTMFTVDNVTINEILRRGDTE